MTETQMYRALMFTTAVLAGLCGLGAVALVVLCAASFSMGVLICALLLAAGAIGCGYTTVYFASHSNTPRVFNNQDEKEVLSNKQRKILKEARGRVVMKRAMVEVEQEDENITHRAIEAANNPDLPPHDTRWTDAMRERVKQITSTTKDEGYGR